MVEERSMILRRMINTEQCIHQDAVIGVADEFIHDVQLPTGGIKNPDSSTLSIRDITGHKHGNADALSRCPNPHSCECSVDTKLKCGPFNYCYHIPCVKKYYNRCTTQ